MANARMSLGSLDYVHIPFEEASTGATSLPVEMSIVLYPLHAEEADWKTAEWATGTTDPTARLLIGPGTSLDLDVGTYVMRARVTGTSVTPIVDADGLLEIF